VRWSSSEQIRWSISVFGKTAKFYRDNHLVLMSMMNRLTFAHSKIVGYSRSMLLPAALCFAVEAPASSALPVSYAQVDLGERYLAFEPNSQASATILGPIIAKKGQILFDNSRIMHLAEIDMPPIEDWPAVTGQPLKSYVYEVSGDLGEMRLGRDICLGGDPKWAVARVTASRYILYYDIALYRGDSPPTTAWDADLCAEVYSFRAPRPDEMHLASR
jgi:hypothetical protein